MASKTDYNEMARKRRKTIRGRNKEAKAIDEAVGKAGKEALETYGKEYAREKMFSIEYPEDWNPTVTRRINKTLTMKDREDPGYKKGGSVKPVWDKARPKSLGKSKPLSPAQKAKAKATAAAAGRPYPNMIDNIRAAKKGK